MIIESETADDKKPLLRDSEQFSVTVSTSGGPTISGASTSYATSSAVSSPLTPSVGPLSPLHERSERDNHLLVDMSTEVAEVNVSTVPDEPPPEFAPYEAESFEVGYEDVVSHDPHLNTDGEALYRFLLTQSESLPYLRINFRGTHAETKYRWVTHRDNQGRQSTRQESYNETITDFDFCVDISPNQLQSLTTSEPGAGASASTPVSGHDEFKSAHWSVADDEPAYRGRMVREYEATFLRSLESSNPLSNRSTATSDEISRYKEWIKRRKALGYPPWFREEDEWGGQEGVLRALADSSRSSLKSTKTLREWADEYCASPKFLKEFVYEKVIYGWDFGSLERSLQSLVTKTPYGGSLSITFTPHNSKIYIRPDNWVSRMLSNKWLKFLSIILLVFPFIWLFKRFHPRGGGRWEVCGGAYPLKKIVDLNETEVNDQGDGKLAREQQSEADILQADPDDELPSYDDVNSNSNSTSNQSDLIEPVLSSIANLISNSNTSLPSGSGLNPRRDSYPHSSRGYNPAYPSRPSPSAVQRMYRRPDYTQNSSSLSRAHLTQASSSSSNPPPGSPQPRIIRTPTGPKKLYGIREGEWFRAFEGVITRAVVGQHQSTHPLQSEHLTPSVGLDGYDEAGLDSWLVSSRTP
ncbi:hypothetical protein CPB83DRAFT_841772 [Crepidotus variabilis]|uniref:Uncharacterized protein n=1 Tax=Crepidotus variabilis TaxID=179855 RepID=A0A9P6ESQ0_9AGAR|nr:hypothetical protein CPB83DRAFT_841772 [Crepidotus variabilis]